MKTTININGKPVEITLTDEQVKQITEASKPKLFNYEYKSTYYISNMQIFEKQFGNSASILEYGRYRRTKEQAEMDFKRQTRVFRLSALAWEVGECVEFEYGVNNFIVVFDYSVGKYIVDHNRVLCCEYAVFMTHSTAKIVCEMLNSGEYSLDVE